MAPPPRHGAHLHSLTRLRFVNAFLVVEDDGLTLVDTMIPGSAKAIFAAVRSLGAPIVRIVLTHAHQDHVGSLDAVAAQLPGVEIAIGARDARLLAGEKSLDPGEPQTKLRGSYHTTGTRPSRLLAAADRVGSLEVHAAPGHTPGQIALLDTRDRTLIAGDAYSTIGGVATTARPTPYFLVPGVATWNRPLALQTARDLRALEPSRLAVGHGRVVENPAAAMDAAIAKGA